MCFLSHMFPNALAPLVSPFMVERAKALSALVDLEIVAPVSFFPFFRTNVPPQVELFDGLNVIHPRYLAFPPALWSLRWVPYLAMLKKNLRKRALESDILHIEWIYPDAYAAVQYVKNKDVKTVGVVHGNEAFEYYGPKSYRQKHIETFALLDKIIVVSADLKSKLIEKYFVKPEKITAILNGVDVGKFPIRNLDKARESLGLPINSLIGVCVARLSEEKNLDVLIRAVAKLKDESPSIYIVGDGPLKSELQEFIDHCGVDGKVKLVGSVAHDEVAMWLNAGDFFCLPSQREGCPVVIHEALACGRPIISTTVGAIPDLICHEDYGLLCPPSDVDALADLLKKAVSRTWDNEKISAYGKQFTWEKVAEQTVDVFRDVLEEN